MIRCKDFFKHTIESFYGISASIEGVKNSQMQYIKGWRDK